MKRVMFSLLVTLFALSACVSGTSPTPQPTLKPTATAPPSTATPTQAPTGTPTPTMAPPSPTPGPWQPRGLGEPCVPSETRSCALLFVLPERYYANHARPLPDRFAEAGYTVVMASNAERVVSVCTSSQAGALELEIPVDLALDEVDVADYDAIIYIGGFGCQEQWEDELAHRIAQQAVAQGMVLGATGCASTILAHAGVLEGKQATVCSKAYVPVKRGKNYCRELEKLGAICVNEPIVRDGLIVTAKQSVPYFVPGVVEVLNEQHNQ